MLENLFARLEQFQDERCRFWAFAGKLAAKLAFLVDIDP